MSNDITPAELAGLGVNGYTGVRKSGASIYACTYLDGAGNWRMWVQSAHAVISWGAEPPNYGNTPYLEPVPGGNINCGNVQAAIDDMADYASGPGAGDWHLEAATNAHEMVHVEYFETTTIPTSFPPVQASIEAHILGHISGMDQVGAIIAMEAYLRVTAIPNWGTRMEDVGGGEEAPAYAAGQVVLDVKIAELNAWKSANCP